jgi:tight adherence protein C
MNPVLLLALLGGAVGGLGIAVALTAFNPGHPRLADALDALDERTVRPPAADAPPSRAARLLLLVARRIPGSVPAADLDLLAIPRDRFLLDRTLTALAYFAAGPVLVGTLALLDTDLHIAVPVAFSLAGAVVGWTGHGRRIRDRAERAREELRYALVSYLQQVSLLRSGGAGIATALTLPAQVLDDSWAMRRVRDELAVAERAGEMPWEGLRRFGQQIDLDELSDLSSIAITAGQDGGTVVGTLLARAESLRDELLADEHADAHRATGQMSTPGAVQVFLIAAWVLFPAGAALLSSF